MKEEEMKTTLLARTAAALAIAALIGCGDGTAPAGDSTVGIKFSVRGASALSSSPASFSVMGAGQAADLSLTGSNGTLDISELRLIVEELELEPVEVGDCDDDGEQASGGCDDFEQRYLFVNVAVDGTPVTVTAADVPPGQYDELELEIEDIEVDDDPDEQADAALIAALFDEVRAAFPEWPAKASMVVVGTFTPTDEDAVDFTTYFEAEIEVEMELDPPLEIVEGSSVDLVVTLDPAAWFQLSDGTVWDLSAIQDQLVEFELDFEDGMDVEVENDDDNNHD